MAEDPERTRRRSSRFLVTLVVLLAVAAFLLLRPIVSGVTFGLVVGFLLQGPYRRAADRARFPRLVAVGFVALLLVVLDAPLFLLGWELFREVQGFVLQVESPDFGPSVVRGLTHLGVPPDAAAQFVQQASADALAYVHGLALSTLSFAGATLMNAGVFLFVLYYTLVSGPTFVEWVVEALPLPEEHARHLVEAVSNRMRNLFLGTFLVATCLGILTGIVWWILALPNPVFWGAVLTVLNLIPALGMGIVVFPACAILALHGQIWQAAVLLLWSMAAAPFVGNGIRALFVGKTRGVHPILVLVGSVGGIAMFGPAGFLLGPLILSMADPILGEWESIREPRAALRHTE